MTPDAVGEHLAHLRLRNLSPASISQRSYALGRLGRFLDCTAAELLAATADDLDRWQRSVMHLSPRYRSTYATHVRQFYRWAVARGLVRDDPSVVLVAVRIPRGLPHPIGEDDLRMALSCAPDRVRPWLILAAYAGLRASEIAGLQRADVRDTANPPVLHITGKGGRERIVPLSDLVLLELQAAGLPSRGYVFGRLDGQAGGNAPSRLSHLCNDYLHGLGITESLHGLRHRFGTIMYAVSRDLRVVQETMGHSSPATTASYVAWSNTAAVNAVQLIAQKDPLRGTQGYDDSCPRTLSPLRSATSLGAIA